MRTARLLGLSPDGRSVILSTDGGEEIAVAVDDRFRAAARGDRPRLGQLEIQMESSLSPRDIQTRIRAGDSLEDVARVAGLPTDRVERFAAPVLAERGHVAATAMASSVRRRGETSGHRNLRIAVTERLVGRKVDLDAVAWDAYRLEDGRWAVTADYPAGETQHQACFTFDLRARYSVASNDEARWLLGEQTAAQPEEDTEPTVDLSDELALVRATAEVPGAVTRPKPAPRSRRLRPVADLPPEEDEAEGETEEAAPAVEPVGLTDATAVPETDPGAEWEPAPVVEIPIEPSLLDETEADGPAQQPEPESEQAAEPEPEPDFALETDPPAPKPSRRKRAAVPSWDDIMFGGPKRPQ